MKDLPRRPESPESEDETPEIESYGEEVNNEADTTLESESEIEDEVDAAPPLSPTPEEREAIIKDKNVIGHINGEMAEILLDFVTTADETLNDDCKFVTILFFGFIRSHTDHPYFVYFRYFISRKKGCNIVGHIINERTRCSLCKTC